MPSMFESPMVLKMAEPLVEYSSHLEPLFPHLEWNLKRSGYAVESAQYISVVLYMSVVVFSLGFFVVIIPSIYTNRLEGSYAAILFTLIATVLAIVYMLLIPTVKMNRRGLMIDYDLEFMLKDMQIQLSAGVPLFDTLVNVARGEYGECSRICEGIIQEVEQGKSITDVLDDVGMWSPSEYFRKALWQIVNALKSGSDVSDALEAISNDIRLEKENKIKAYGRELNLYGLIYLMCAVILPSMGVTLLVILSSFLGKGIINETTFYIILFILIVGQTMFIMFVKSKRPTI
ncbi:MAG: type II secretion system F family protein [Candidatus Altiarchaeota archaeon]